MEKVFHGVMMDWQVYNTIEGMKEGADLRKMVILESIQEAMLVSSRSRDEIPQAQFEGAMDKLHTLKALAGNGAKAVGKYMKTLLAAGLLGASLTACAGGQVPQVDPMRTAEFSVQKDASMTDEQIAELGQECLLLITEELDRNQLGNPNPINTEGWRKAATLYEMIAKGELRSPATVKAQQDLAAAKDTNDTDALAKAQEELKQATQRTIGALVAPINKLYHQKLGMAPDFQTWFETVSNGG